MDRSDAFVRAIEGADPPPRTVESAGSAPALLWLGARAHRRQLKAYMAGQPYDVVLDVVGSERSLVERGVVDRRRSGPEPSRWRRAYVLRYVRRGGGGPPGEGGALVPAPRAPKGPPPLRSAARLPEDP